MSTINFDSLWQQVLAILEEELSRTSFETWVRSTKPLSYDGRVLKISTPNPFAKDWLESRYYYLIKNTLELLTGEETELEFVLPQKTQNYPNQLPFFKPPCSQNSSSALNPKYTFDSFVVGNSNRFTHAACLAVAESPAKTYNPLFIYGGVGLGKTHLMHAIGHHVLNKFQRHKVVYAPSEKFTNELINSIRDDRTEGFRQKYRNIDVLLIDDIQFLAGKERTQEEFFHTFNTLHEANRQLIISSDRPPKEIPTLEERLRSRFEWGLITDIQPPDFETRMAILSKKANLENITLANEVLAYIAQEIQTNIRELEGALLRLAAYQNISKQEITLEAAALILKDLIPPKKAERITIELIQKATADYFNLRLEDFQAKKRTHAVAYPRQIAMYLCRELTDASLPKIGEEFGGRDHSTVIHAYEKISHELTTNPSLQQIINELISQLHLKEKI